MVSSIAQADARTYMKDLRNTRVNIISASTYKDHSLLLDNLTDEERQEIAEERAEAREENIDFYNEFADELEISRRVEFDEHGHRLQWPLEYPPKENIDKIVIHHTASTSNSSSLESVKAIFESHATIRGWGDIGYHYIIGREGKIYEGRPKDTVGAHASGFNTNSIGIALIGNFQNMEPTDEQMESLLALTYKLTREYNINPKGSSRLRGKNNIPNIVRHDQLNATSCPGKNIIKRMDVIRNTVQSGRYNANDAKLFNRHAVTRTKRTTRVTRKSTYTPARTISRTAQLEQSTVEPGQIRNIRLRLNNMTSNFITNNNTVVEVVKDDAVQILSKEIELIHPTASGDIKLQIKAPELPGEYTIYVKARRNGELISKKALTHKLIVEGDPVETSPVISQPVSTSSIVAIPTTTSGNRADNDIRIKLSGFDKRFAIIKSDSKFGLYEAGKLKKQYPADSTVFVRYTGGKYTIINKGETLHTTNPPQFSSISGNGIMQVVNLSKRTAWNRDINDNYFRGAIEVVQNSSTLAIVNELDLEDYARGVAESIELDPEEKKKALMVAARSYGLYYITIGDKFPGKPWHLDDDPRSSQKYLGYNFELRAPNIVQAAEDTYGQVVTSNGEVIRAAYFSRSDGKKTRSAGEVWGWSAADYPYLVSVKDSYCESDGNFAGHGVGLSFCGAKGMAERGFDYQQILEYYYTGANVTKVY